MGVYLNPSDSLFKRARNSDIYVDKSLMLAFTNSVLGSENCYLCVSRPRRFGKTMAANMLAAYYSKSCDSGALFQDLAIAKHPSYAKYRNKYNVLFINTLELWRHGRDFEGMCRRLVKLTLEGLNKLYPQIVWRETDFLSSLLRQVFEETGDKFVIIIDEWDCLLREVPSDSQILRSYLHFLQDLLKDKAYVALAYITGILPVRKYGSQSALNMFREYTMINPAKLAEFVGFTDGEVKALSQRYECDYEEIRHWYDGYVLNNGLHIYSPCSVVRAIESGICDNYWTSTESFESLRQWIMMNFDGLRLAIERMLAGETCLVNVRPFNNSFSDINSRDTILSLLIHLGYLGYDFNSQSAYIPNQEIAEEFSGAISQSDWGQLSKTLEDSRQALQSVWDRDEEAVASAIERAHYETSILDYNSEKALRYTVLFAFYMARRYYNVVQECPAGKGFADMIFLPTPRYANKPALVIELKWDNDANTAIRQIVEKNYLQALEGYSGQVLLVGISYDKETKKHECQIRSVECGGWRVESGEWS